jgi:hypothetical protein
MTDDLRQDRLEALMEELHGLSRGILAAKGLAEQRACLLRMGEIAAERKKVGAELWAKLEALVAAAEGEASLDSATQVARFISAYEFAIRLDHLSQDVTVDDELQAKACHKAVAIMQRLDALTGGPQWALPLLDHDDIGVRGAAAAHLANSMPEKALPILRDISDNADPHAARMSAFKFLMIYDRENRKS